MGQNIVPTVAKVGKMKKSIYIMHSNLNKVHIILLKLNDIMRGLCKCECVVLTRHRK